MRVCSLEGGAPEGVSEPVGVPKPQGNA